MDRLHNHYFSVLSLLVAAQFGGLVFHWPRMGPQHGNRSADWPVDVIPNLSTIPFIALLLSPIFSDAAYKYFLGKPESVSGPWLICLLVRWKNAGEQSLWLDLRLLILLATYYLMPNGYKIFVVSIQSLILWLGSVNGSGTMNSTSSRDQSDANRKAFLVPARTTHSRFFPRQHSLSYSYLQVLFPIEYEGRYGPLLSVGTTSWWSWFNVRSTSYLDRGGEHFSFKEKLALYLRSQGVQDDEWDHAYLSTAPRFLGYSFNPVSFWYIYDSHHHLKFMILEVNNTFDERRIYLLKGQALDEFDNDGTVPEGRTAFKDSWTKDFHVSPFSSRKGSYKLRAIDPFGGQSSATPRIDNTITLMSSKDHPKLVARIFSEGEAVPADSTNALQILRFVGQWCWVGFVTFPRILKEAALLFFRRGLNVWFRPEVLPSSIGRTAAKAETELAAFFRQYLEHLVENASTLITINFKDGVSGGEIHSITQKFITLEEARLAARIVDSGAQSVYSPQTISRSLRTEKNREIATQSIDITILSPAFYTRFVHYAHTREAFDREAIFADDKNRTAVVSNPLLLNQLLREDPMLNSDHWDRSISKSLRWRIMKFLRCSPAVPAYPERGVVASMSAHAKDIRARGYSPLDCFVFKHCKDRGSYRRLVSKLFLAQRLTFGIVEVVGLADLVIRSLLQRWFVLSVLVPGFTGEHAHFGQPPDDFVLRWFTVISHMLAITGIHLWEIAKGFE